MSRKIKRNILFVIISICIIIIGSFLPRVLPDRPPSKYTVVVYACDKPAQVHKNVPRPKYFTVV